MFKCPSFFHCFPFTQLRYIFLFLTSHTSLALFLSLYVPLSLSLSPSLSLLSHPHSKVCSSKLLKQCTVCIEMEETEPCSVLLCIALPLCTSVRHVCVFNFRSVPHCVQLHFLTSSLMSLPLFPLFSTKSHNSILTLSQNSYFNRLEIGNR